MHVRAEFVQVSAHCSSSVKSWSTVSVTPALVHAQILVAAARLDPRRIPPGKTLYLPAWREAARSG